MHRFLSFHKFKAPIALQFMLHNSKKYVNNISMVSFVDTAYVVDWTERPAGMACSVVSWGLIKINVCLFVDDKITNTVNQRNEK